MATIRMTGTAVTMEALRHLSDAVLAVGAVAIPSEGSVLRRLYDAANSLLVSASLITTRDLGDAPLLERYRRLVVQHERQGWRHEEDLPSWPFPACVMKRWLVRAYDPTANFKVVGVARAGGGEAIIEVQQMMTVAKEAADDAAMLRYALYSLKMGVMSWFIAGAKDEAVEKGT
jgi:hypothetical protein